MIQSDGRHIGLECYVSSHLPLTSVIWCREPGDSISPDIKSYNGFSSNGIRILTLENLEKDDFATYKCIASNIIGTVESDPVQPNDDERQKFIHELFLKGECGRLHFARLVFIGKNGVGKTSLMRRLLWHKKEDVTSTKSTDGIEVEKCNINIDDGKWSPCKETDDDVRRLIHQVFKGKILNVERKDIETIDDPKPFSSNEDEPRSVSSKEPSTSFDESDTINILHENYKGERNTSDDTGDIQTFISDNKDNHVTVNLMPPDSFKLENIYDSDINHLTKQNESDPINDENINEMTSTIMKSCLQFREKEQDDMLAFCWLWDFAGQKDFYATHQVFLSKHAVFLLVTDSLEFTTAENQGNNFESSAQYVSFWFDAIHCYWSTTIEGRLDPPIIVVCTNEDKFKTREKEKRQTKFKENLNHVLKGQEKKRHLRNIYFISNTEDTDIVFEEIRKEISRQAMTMQDWGKDCPLKWLLFQRVLMKLKDNNVPISSTKSLLKIAKHKDIDISEDNEVKQCLQYCHDIGTVVYFDEDKLADHVILDPKWLINAFRCLVSDKIDNVIEISDDWETLTDTGQLTDSLISLLFEKEPELKFVENKAHLVEVMKRFDIIDYRCLEHKTNHSSDDLVKPWGLNEELDITNVPKTNGGKGSFWFN
ncbi:probable serine/threonine-protein kinase roco6 [Mytilus trossulus]|uniref:probable serine/threonine-protein kinase roco6 n=1 Tax=Mytilus trossulus TaxID=6551 RepID=UPI003007D90E